MHPCFICQIGSDRTQISLVSESIRFFFKGKRHIVCFNKVHLAGTLKLNFILLMVIYLGLSGTCENQKRNEILHYRLDWVYTFRLELDKIKHIMSIKYGQRLDTTTNTNTYKNMLDLIEAGKTYFFGLDYMPVRIGQNETHHWYRVPDRHRQVPTHSRVLSAT